MNTIEPLSANSPTAQAFSGAVEPKLRVHRDGRVSIETHRTLDSVHDQIPAEIFYRVPQSQRHRLLQDSFAGSRGDAAQVVIARFGK